MNKQSKIILLSSTLLATALTVASCGGDENTGDSANPAVNLKIAVTSDKTETSIAEALIKGFNQTEGNKNVKISVVKITQGYDSYIQKNWGKSTMADLISVYDYNAEYWTSMNLFKPLSTYMERDGVKEEDYVSSMFNLGKSGTDDTYYWLPRDYNKVVVCYNTEIFEAAGISKPSDNWTMEDFEQTCKTLLEKSEEIKKVTGKYDFWPAEMNLKWTAVYYPYIKSYGGGFLADDGTCFKNPDIVKSSLLKLLKYADPTDSVNYPGLGYSNPIGQADDQACFVNKKAAMIFTVRPNIQSFAKNLNNNIDFVSLPSITDNDGKTSYIGSGCSGYTITTNCSDDKVEAAWRFLKYIVSKEGQEVLGETGSGIPVLSSLLNDSSSAWKNFISKDLNHDAFTKFPERDLSMNYVHGFKANKQLTIYKEFKDSLIFSMYNSEDRDEEFAAFKSKIDALVA